MIGSGSPLTLREAAKVAALLLLLPPPPLPPPPFLPSPSRDVGITKDPELLTSTPSAQKRICCQLFCGWQPRQAWSGATRVSWQGHSAKQWPSLQGRTPFRCTKHCLTLAPETSRVHDRGPRCTPLLLPNPSHPKSTRVILCPSPLNLPITNQVLSVLCAEYFSDVFLFW